MLRNNEKIAADFDALIASDFDSANANARGWERLFELCEEVIEINDSTAFVPVFFRTMERLDGVDLGTPGPLVHSLERWPGSYETLLARSIQKRPVSLSVWMVNRILNSKPPDSDMWLGLLRDVADSPTASAETIAEANLFIEHQIEANR